MLSHLERSLSATALVALGANVARPGSPPAATLADALAALEEAGLRVQAQSRFYRTPAFPAGSGPDFVNACAALEVPAQSDARALLATLHRVEIALGRERRDRWEPRVCDLDLLAMADFVLPDRPTLERWMGLAPEEARRLAPEGLILPHPRLHERAFVLVPLADVAPNWVHPALGRTVAEMVAALPAAARAEIQPIARER
ncbi:MAG: 2-amino-4-hydroxy-6-hydroxymethyldihydropteridine diphosphokinase [Pseudomonadota bacterium]